MCKLLVENGANCLLEDNYRQTPFVLAAKRDYFDILILFVQSIKLNLDLSKSWPQVRKAAYTACCSGNFDILKYIFENFELKLEKFVHQSSEHEDSLIGKQNFSELNPLHVACYKSYFNIVQFLLENLEDKKCIGLIVNSTFNEYRDSTSLEEAFKGFLMFDLNSTFDSTNNLLKATKLEGLKQEREIKITNYKNLINLLIESGAKFSNNFIINEGMSKLLAQVFSGARKDLDFVHFLFCCNFLFKYKLNEIFNYNGAKIEEKEFNLKEMLEDFMAKVYLTCNKVIKDHKAACLNYYVEMVLSLHYTGQLYIRIKQFEYLKERNMEIYRFFEEIASKSFSLKLFCSIAVREAIGNYGIGKVNALNIPTVLKNEIFLNSIYRTSYSNRYDYYTYLLCKDFMKNF